MWSTEISMEYVNSFFEVRKDTDYDLLYEQSKV